MRNSLKRKKFFFKNRHNDTCSVLFVSDAVYTRNLASYIVVVVVAGLVQYKYCGWSRYSRGLVYETRDNNLENG